jgi:cell division protein FtsB
MSNFVASVEIFRQYHAQKSCVGGAMTSPIASAETQKVGGGYKLLAGIALIMGVSMVLVILFSKHGFYNVFRFRQDGLKLEQENNRLAAENTRLARSIDRLQNDPEYIQDRIRQELNFVKPNELIFQFPPEKPVTAPNLTATATGVTPPPTKVQAISTRKAGTGKWVSAPPEGSSQKKPKPHRE